MNNTILSLVASGFILVSSSSFATNKTEIDTKWICTTNASTSQVPSDIAIDKQMQEKALAVAEAFAIAKDNCRDCTKISCEAQSE